MTARLPILALQLFMLLLPSSVFAVDCSQINEGVLRLVCSDHDLIVADANLECFVQSRY